MTNNYEVPAVGARATREASLADYIRIARLDHLTKHIFIAPGAIFAYILRGVQTDTVLLHVFLGLLCAICIASANYTINEWLDREFDKHHPTKSTRAAVQADLKGGVVFVEWAFLVGCGLLAAYFSGPVTIIAAVLFALQGIVYNVSPIRTKDKPYLDVISESINNPLRLMIGWGMIDPFTAPPGSIIVAYWLGGAFLMAAKRLSEYREIVSSHGKDLLVRYRKSFSGYSEISLTVSTFSYAMLSIFFLVIFLIKYRIEYILAMPFVIALFPSYIASAMQPGSSAQSPEKLYRERVLMILVLALTATFVLTSIVDIPEVETLAVQHFITLPWK